MIPIEIIMAIIAMLIASFPILGVAILGLIMAIGLPTGFIALIVLIIQGIRNSKASKINYHAMVDDTQRLLQKYTKSGTHFKRNIRRLMVHPYMKYLHYGIALKIAYAYGKHSLT